MTVTDNGATGDATGFTVEDDRILARAAWHESGGTLTGRQLAERYGRSPRWGQKQRAAAEREVGGRGTGADPGEGTQAVPRTAPKPKPAARTRHTPTATPRVLTWGMKLGFVVVAAVTAVASYMHIRDLALAAGMGSHGYWTPLGIDGMALVCSCSVIVDRRRGTTPDLYARLGLAAGFAGSLIANVLAVDTTLVSLQWVAWVLAGYTPIALMVAGHLYLRHMGDR